MTHCPSCNIEVAPVHELGQDGKVSPHCPNHECRVRLPDPTVIQLVAPVQVPIQKQSANDYNELDVDILAMARNKLGIIEAKIAVLSKLKGEAAGLRAMIAAAESANPVELT